MKITTMVMVKDLMTGQETFGVENLPNKKAFMDFCSEAFNRQKETPLLSITIRIVRIDK